jgi:DNA repair exonuclease SbcCD ATPase subunit
MLRFLLTVSIFCIVAVAGLGFLNRAKLRRLTQQLAEAQTQSNQACTQLTELGRKLNQAEERLATQERLTQQERDARNAELNAIKSKLNQATEQLTVRDGENRALTAALTEAGRNLEQKQRAEDDRQALAQRLVKVEKKLNQFRITSSRIKGKSAPRLEGSVLSINPDAQALTVSLGSDIGVIINSRLTIERNGQTMSQLRVVSVEPNSCTAEFVASTPDKLSKVAVGDQVIAD